MHRTLAKLGAVHRKQFAAVIFTSELAGGKLSNREAGKRFDPPVTQEAARQMAMRGMRFIKESLEAKEGCVSPVLCALEAD